MPIETNCAVLSAGLAAVIKASSTDDTRPHIYGVLIESNGSGALEFTATNGHFLARCQFDGGHMLPGGIGDVAPLKTLVPLKAAKEALAKAKKHRGTKKSPLIESAVVTLDSFEFQDGSTIHFEPSREEFPPTGRVIPSVDLSKGVERAPAVGMNPEYLALAGASIAAAMKTAWTGPGHGYGISIAFGATDLDPVSIAGDFRTPKGIPARALWVVMPLVMPLRSAGHRFGNLVTTPVPPTEPTEPTEPPEDKKAIPAEGYPSSKHEDLSADDKRNARNKRRREARAAKKHAAGAHAVVVVDEPAMVVTDDEVTVVDAEPIVIEGSTVHPWHTSEADLGTACECGELLPTGSRFCGHCGSKLAMAA